MAPIVKTTGSSGLHVYVAIVRGPTQKQVWRFAKRFAFDLAALRPDLVTAEYRIAKRPPGRVLVDYNQNAWGRTLASAYSPRPRPLATVSAPITWDELDAGARIEDFDVFNMPARIAAVGDLWAPLLAATKRFDLARCSARSADLRQPVDGRVRAAAARRSSRAAVEVDRLDQVLVEAGSSGALAIRAAGRSRSARSAARARVRGSARSAAASS